MQRSKEAHNTFEMNDTKQRRTELFSSKSLLLLFAVGALVNFVLSVIDGRSLAECVISAFLGLLGVGWYALLYWGASHNDPDHWVP